MEEHSGERFEVCMCRSVQAGVLSVLTKTGQLRENWLKRACRAWNDFTMPVKDRVTVKYISRFWFSTVVPHLWWNIWKENLLMNSVLLELTLRKPTGKVASQMLQMKIFYFGDDLIWLKSVFSLENGNSTFWLFCCYLDPAYSWEVQDKSFPKIPSLRSIPAGWEISNTL